MQTTHTIPTDSQQKITVESQLLYVLWQQGRAYAGFEAHFEVKTLLVGNGAKVKATLRTVKGKKLDKIEGVIVLNKWRGKVVIPEKVRPDDYVYLEVELPKHGLDLDSNEIPVRAPIEVSSIGWSRQVIHRDEEVTLSCNFTNGVEDDDKVTVIVYEYDNDGNHHKVVTIPATIEHMKIELKWKFIYQEDTGSIPSEEELRKYGKAYTPPEYFFVVMVDTVPVGSRQESGLLTFTDTVDLTIRKGRMPPQPDDHYVITTADGIEATCTPDTEGVIQLEKVSPGPCTVCPADMPAEEQQRYLASFKTGTKTEYTLPETVPLVDGHMHIQSNNCCPLPVQMGVLARKGGFIFGREIGRDRKDLIDITCAWYAQLLTGRFGKVSRLSSDLVGRLYMNDLDDMDMKSGLTWTVFDKDKEKRLREKKGYNTEKLRIKAGEKAGLKNMNTASVQAWQEHFLESTSYYYENTKTARISLALCMDLSFTNYWGRFGLPVYLDTDDDKYFINDFAAIALKRKGLSDCVKLTFEESVVTPESDGDLTVNRDKKRLFRERATVHLHASFTEKDRFGNTPAPFYRRQLELSSRMQPAEENDLPMLKFNAADNTMMELTSKKFVHLLADARGEEKKWFEDYAMQRELTIATMVNYPLKLFGGYHYDPRRHLLGEEGYDIDSMAENIVSNHAFFTARHDGTEQQHFSNGVYYQGAVMLSPNKQLNDKQFIKQLLSEQQRTTPEALEELFPYNDEGLFWCVKLYPRLGWAPDDFACYPNLKTLYTLCGKTVPIMVHCSLGGMSAHDYFLYERYDDHVIKDEYKLKHAELRFNGDLPGVSSNDSPVQWKNVLREFPELKICLAHFGGYDTWKDVWDFEKAQQRLAERGNASNPDKYDKYDKYRDWIRTIAELVSDYDNVYTDISYFSNTGSFRSTGRFRDDDDAPEYSGMVAANLVYLLEKYPDLKDRLMVGTDWQMIELEGENGIGEYMARMFETLKEVSRSVGYDAWHQFAVVNPLRYLGLIEEAKGTEGPFEVKVERLEKFSTIFESKLTDIKYKMKYNIKISKTDFDRSVNDTINDFKNFPVQDSKQIKKNNNLIILKNFS